MSKYYETKSPCKNCAKREVGCHTGCTLYQDWCKSGKEIPKKVTYKKAFRKWKTRREK